MPEKVRYTGVEALSNETLYSFLELVPMRLGMADAEIWNILPMDRSGSTPAYYFSWPHETTPEALARNIGGLKRISRFFAPVLAVAKSYAEKNGLQIDLNDPPATVSKLAVITQKPQELHFPT